MGEGAVVVDALQVPPGAGGVHGADVVPPREAADAGGVLVAPLLAGLRPVVQQIAHVRQRIAQRAEFPIQERRHAPVADHHVADAVVAVNHRRPHLFRHVFVQQAGALLHLRYLVRLGGLPLLRPALELAGHVAFLAGERAEADGVHVRQMQRGQHFHDVLPGAAPLRWRDGGRQFRIVRHHALHEGHHVERLAVDGFVLAQAVGGRHGHVRGGEGGDDAVLPRHVVGALQDVAQRRAAQHVGAAVGVRELVGEVGVAAGDQLERQRRRQAVYVGRGPGRHVVEVDTLHRCCHRLPPLFLKPHTPAVWFHTTLGYCLKDSAALPCGA